MNRIGIIAEDRSDIDVVCELIKKIAPDKRFASRGFVGHGCGKILGKCFAWAQVLKSQQCTSLILLRDLDTRVLRDLDNQLRAALNPSPIARSIIIIPIRCRVSRHREQNKTAESHDIVNKIKG